MANLQDPQNFSRVGEIRNCPDHGPYKVREERAAEGGGSFRWVNYTCPVANCPGDTLERED